MPLIPFALLSPTPHISIGPFAICSLLTSQALLNVADCDVTPTTSPDRPNCEDDTHYLQAATVLTFLVAVTQLFLSVLGVGEFVSCVLSVPVTKAYCSACAFYIATSQIKNFLEINVRSTNKTLALFGAWRDLVVNAEHSNMYSLVFGSVAVVVMLVSKKISPLFPIELFVVVSGILFCYGLGYQHNMSIVGKFSGLPDFAIPEIGKYGLELFPHSLLVTLITYIISISIVKNFSIKHKYEVRGNQHLFALGVANLFGSFFHSYPASGSLSRSVALESAGGQTTVSSFITATLLLVTLLWLTSLFRDLPKSILAAIIFVALKNLFFRCKIGFDLWRARHHHDAVVWFSTFFGTLVIGMQYGVLVGMGMSILMLTIQLHSHSAFARTTRAMCAEMSTRASNHVFLRYLVMSSSSESELDARLLPSSTGENERQERSSTTMNGVELSKIGGINDLIILTYSFGTPLCFLNMDLFNSRLFEALDWAHADVSSDNDEDDVKSPDFENDDTNCDQRSCVTTTTVLLLDFDGIDFVDMSAMTMLTRLITDLSARSEGIRPYFISCSEELLAQMKCSKIYDNVGEEFFVDSHTHAMSHIRQNVARDNGETKDGDTKIFRASDIFPTIQPRVAREASLSYHLRTPPVGDFPVIPKAEGASPE